MTTSSNPAKSNFQRDYLLVLRGALNRVKPVLKGRNILFLAIAGILFGFLPFFHSVKNVEADIDLAINEQVLTELTFGLPLLQENSCLPVSSPSGPDIVVRKLRVVATGYSSSPWQTDDTPFLTASGKSVKNGIVANNLLPFGTKIRIPEIYGNQIFVVEDRMKWDRSKYQVDIWFSSYQAAKNFGAQITYIEVLGS